MICTHRITLVAGLHRLLVGSPPMRDLLLRAKHLFVAAMVCLGWRAAHIFAAAARKASPCGWAQPLAGRAFPGACRGRVAISGPALALARCIIARCMVAQ
jgi:hypothetical protein